jgi:hypothetical protein
LWDENVIITRTYLHLAKSNFLLDDPNE